MENEKKESLIDEYFGEWMEIRKVVENEESAKNNMFCTCGRLATGLHERSCRKFQNMVNAKAYTKLKRFVEKENKNK